MEVVITDMDYEVDYYEEKTRKILVFGSGGQVGAYITEYLRCWNKDRRICSRIIL